MTRTDPAALALYAAAVAEGRRELYYAEWDVPDTVEGRFDMISLTVALMNRRIGFVENASALQKQELSQTLFDVMFADMDVNLRELGVSDEGMKHRIKPMASAHLGRVKAYTDALETADEGIRVQALHDALMRNVYRTLDHAQPQPLALRILELVQQLTACPDDALMAGRFTFLAPQNDEHPNNGSLS